MKLQTREILQAFSTAGLMMIGNGFLWLFIDVPRHHLYAIGSAVVGAIFWICANLIRKYFLHGEE